MARNSRKAYRSSSCAIHFALHQRATSDGNARCVERQKFARQLETRGLTVAEILDGYAALAIVVTPAIITPTIARDPPDDAVLATALAARSHAIVSGDAHLLDLKVYRSIPILTPAAALQFVAKAR